jgi:Cdc6-like AAA superfamily ATPase
LRPRSFTHNSKSYICRLTESQEFKHWLATPGSHLWLSGIPGAGKTVLASSVIEEALKFSDSKNAVAFFYCDYKNTATQEPLKVLGCIASHLARQNEDCLDKLRVYYKTCNPDRNTSRPPDKYQLRNLVLEMASHFNNVAILVDGLDECGQTTVEVVELLVSLGDRCPTIKTLFLSRNEQNIKELLMDYSQISIAARSSDLKLYVASEIELRTRTRKLRLTSNQLKEHILDKLVNGADGM